MIVPTLPPYARRGPGLAMRPGRRPLVAALGQRRRDRRRVRIPSQGPAWRITGGKGLVRRLVDLLVGRRARLFSQLGLRAGTLVGHLLPPRIEPSRNLRTRTGDRKWAGPGISR